MIEEIDLCHAYADRQDRPREGDERPQRRAAAEALCLKAHSEDEPLAVRSAPAARQPGSSYVACAHTQHDPDLVRWYSEHPELTGARCFLDGKPLAPKTGES